MEMFLHAVADVMSKTQEKDRKQKLHNNINNSSKNLEQGLLQT